MGDSSSLTNTTPTAPSAEEQQWYYYGLPSQPKLVARSSTRPWKHEFDWFPIGKVLDPVGQHVLVDMWNDSTHSNTLRRDIFQALEAVQWTSIDILRIGYQRKSDFTGEEFTHPVTLFISVERGSTPWPQGYAVVKRCLEILQTRGITDVDVDVKESSTFLSFTDNLGLSIAPFDNPGHEGTKGLYLRQKDTGAVLLLTCRHVLFGGNAANETYTYDDSNHRITVIQPGEETFEESKSEVAGRIIDHNIANLEKGNTWIKSEQRRDSEINEEQLALSHLTEKTQPMLAELEDPAARIIGHVIFSPKLGPSTDEATATRVRDWALIQLHPDKHQSCFDELQNLVKLRDECYSSREGEIRARSEYPYKGEDFWLWWSLTTVLLEGLVPEYEIRRRGQEREMSPILVGTRGSQSGPRVGFLNNVMSITREPIDDHYCISEVWCVLAYRQYGVEDRRRPFSCHGDSGACVWGGKSRVVGLLTGGSGNINEDYRALDITYVTSMEWLLEDIKRHGFDVELL
ncbi:hypothetical protein FZEAL_7868 [Fusarium zealandicum]|uniref:Uncharacterized protein n=1 Tax=Fusarium zealandicum TaxID=1053134 RepID=A0A8H4UF94_9HYPO|nr:hypothetical protein FZEAL_7868 [Fusarium zealandicum]